VITTDLYLIRHGESVANVEPIIGGRRGDAGLTDRGHRQAELLQRRLMQHRVLADVLYTSTLPRARQTAAYVSRALGLPAMAEDGLRELDPGAADGMSVAEWQDRYPGLEHGPAADPFHEFAPGGESWAGFLARAGATLQTLVRRHPDQTVVAVTHGGVIECSLLLALGLGATFDQLSLDLANTGVTHWRHHADRDPGRPSWTLVALSDAHHLVDEVSGEPPRPAVPTPADE
jgi:probable phosphoglycerate mutase